MNAAEPIISVQYAGRLWEGSRHKAAATRDFLRRLPLRDTAQEALLEAVEKALEKDERAFCVAAYDIALGEGGAVDRLADALDLVIAEASPDDSRLVMGGAK